MSAATEPRKARIGRNALESLGFRGLALPIGLVTSVVTSRFLQPSGRGVYVLALVSVMIAVTLLSTGTAVGHEIGRDKQPVRATVTSAVLAACVLGVLGGLALLAINLGVSSEQYGYVRLAAAALPAMLVVQALSGALLALGRVRAWNVVQLAAPALVLIAMLVLVAGVSLTVTGAIVAWVLGQTLTAVIALVLARDLWWPVRMRAMPARRTRAMLGLSLRLGVTNLVGLVNYRIELVLLGMYLGLHAVGIYSLATSLAELIWVVSWALSSAIVAPAVKASGERAAAIAAAGARHSLIVASGAGLVLAGLGTLAIPAVYGDAFAESRAPLAILAIAAVSMSPSSSLAVYFSMKLGRSRYSFVGALLSASLTGGLAVWLIPAMGVVGAAVATTVGYSVSQVVEMVWFARLTGLPVKDLVPRASDLSAYRDLVRSFTRTGRLSAGLEPGA